MLKRAPREDLAGELVAARQRIAELEAERQKTARTDPLTGCLAVGHFRSRMSDEVDRARRYRRPLSLALIDIDGFRAAQLQHGFPFGDRVLRAIGEMLRSFTRSVDLVCRSGGDEFAVLMPETDAPSARKCFERILLELEVLDVGARASVSASMGIAELCPIGGAERLLDRASEALGRARDAGGGRVELLAATGAAIAGEKSKPREAIEALAMALAERDPYTADHSESIVDLAGEVARSLGLPADDIDRIRAAALLHDIGKVAIPDAILHKPGKLDDEEWQLMLQHPVVGERILRAVPGLGSIARIVRHEHERWDGGGYPDGLAGEAIPIGSRIILACDAYHAMTSDRPYRAAMPHSDAVRELSRSAGTQFDPQVTAALVGHLYGQYQAGRIVSA
jgi:diguanylate cyclase (GGDEF)-like protein/putative nucleotidyltransferase with HDIG domain